MSQKLTPVPGKILTFGPEFFWNHPFLNRQECWVDPRSLNAQRALETIGGNLQRQYERCFFKIWHITKFRWETVSVLHLTVYCSFTYLKSFVKSNEMVQVAAEGTISPIVGPNSWRGSLTISKKQLPGHGCHQVRRLATGLRRAAREERVLFHYNGHGVPKPTANGEIWVFNRSAWYQAAVSIKVDNFQVLYPVHSFVHLWLAELDGKSEHLCVSFLEHVFAGLNFMIL